MKRFWIDFKFWARIRIWIIRRNWIKKNTCEKEKMQITKKWKQCNIALSTTHIYLLHCTKKKFSNKAFFSKCDQIQRKLRIWSHLLKLSLMENFFFLCSVIYYCKTLNFRCLRQFSLDSTRSKFFDIPHSLL